MSRFDDLYAAMAKRHGGLMCAGFRDDMSDMERWVAYCMSHSPITYRLYIDAVAGGIEMPEATEEEMSTARAWLAGQKERHR